MACLNDEELEVHLLVNGAESSRHVEGCASCSARVAEATSQAQHFRAYVAPRTLDALLEAAAPRRAGLRRWLPIALGVAAVASIAVIAMPALGPSPDYVGLKGGADRLRLRVFTVGDESAPVELEDGARVRSGAPLRFKVEPPAPCALWLVSLDASGAVSRLFPATGAAPRVSLAAPLPGGAVLDAATGPERLFAVCGRDELSFATVEAAVKRLGTGTDAVRSARGLDALPDGTRQATVLLEKVAQ